LFEVTQEYVCYDIKFGVIIVLVGYSGLCLYLHFILCTLLVLLSAPLVCVCVPHYWYCVSAPLVCVPHYWCYWVLLWCKLGCVSQSTSLHR